MDAQHLSASSHTPLRVAGKRPGDHSPGVIHVNTRHTTRFTVVGNHLAQHAALSLVAIGLAVHIQSLPTGARIDIKTLAARFPEGAQRVAGALRELEAHGYLRRVRERRPDGRITTRTLSCNQPSACGRAGEAVPRTPPPPGPAPAPAPAARTAPSAPAPMAEPAAEPAAESVAEAMAEPGPEPGPESLAAPPAEPEPGASAESVTAYVVESVAGRGPAGPSVPGSVAVREPGHAPAPPCGTKPVRPPRRARVPLRVPQPAFPAASLLKAATELLAGLHRHDPRLVLSARDTEELAPGVAAWLERDVTPQGVRQALLRLPGEPLRYPAAFLAHRLTADLPPAVAGPVSPPHPLQNCDVCDRAYRAPAPGVCGGCRVLVAEERERGVTVTAARCAPPRG
ncbi:helix-turn-helix domain-containing protein [Streptomyces fradiae]|uniref:helix-turn-helix domain-containing protein n=1 Tax=Streptomyces fradiae TaxID=1906 RepID=UPI0037BD41A6